MYTFADLQNEVKRRATRDQAGTVYDTAIKNAINFSLFRLSRECGWRAMRKKTTLDTVTSYTTGSGAVSATNGSASVSVTGATLLTDSVNVSRRVKISGSSAYYTIKTITGETTFTIDQEYSGTTTTTGTYEIYPQEEYNLPIQCGHRMFLWHEDYGYPCKLTYSPNQEFIDSGADIIEKGTPLYYRMWGEDMVIEQVRAASVVTVSSSESADTSIGITVFGVVSGYPDYEVITTNSGDGTTAVAGSKSFSSIDRVVKNASTTGRITVTANSANTTIAVLPVGDTTAGIMYKKIMLYPLPDSVFPINVYYYKDPYRLVNDGDVHELGADFDEAIILLATSKIKAESNQSEGQEYYGYYVDEVRSLRRTNMDKIDWLPTLKKPTQSGSNDLRVGNSILRYRQIGSNYGPRVRY